ncbi:phage tail tube protein [Chromobacterium vaccinii]|uniref:phage tail tube protein n=1 Tax=Chromobacterium vaccinii TaxID=1108595 RepID=UPI003C70FDE7
MAINIPAGSGVRLATCVETAQGALPANPAFKAKRITSLKPQFQRDALKSDELSVSRQVLSMRLGMYKANYQFDGNLLLGGWDDELACAMNNSWTAGPAFSGSASVAGAAGTITRSAGSWITDGFMAGEWVKLAGFTAVANNAAIAQINVVTTKVLTLSIVSPTGSTLVDEEAAAGRSVTVIGKFLTVGQASALPGSLSIEHYIPGNGVYELYSGMCVDKMTISAKPNEMVKISFDFVGLNSVQGTVANGTSYPAAPTNAPMDAFSAPLYIGGQPVGNITSMMLNLQNGRKAADGVLGSKVAPAIIEGTNEVTIDFTAYFSDQALVQAFRNETNVAIDLPFFDVNGVDFIKLRMGNVKILSADEDIKLNAGVLLNIKAQALADPGTAVQTGTQYGTNLLIQRSNPA